MPFVKRQGSKQPHRTPSAKTTFIGRSGELGFFVENILQPEDPTHNIISISGQAGVGKSTLVARFIQETTALTFKDYCSTALVDERQNGVVSIMEKIANQLHIAGKFEQALLHYKASLLKLQAEREAAEEGILHKLTTDIAGSAMKQVPVVGGMLELGTELAVEYIWDELHYRQLLKDAKLLANPIDDLTKAFVEELNVLADTQVTLDTTRTKRRRRVVLFFDTFEQLADEVAPWLLDNFLVAEISVNVVLVVAGRTPIEYSIPDDPKRWLTYTDDNIIYHISLESFTKDETQDFLSKRGIIEPSNIDKIWRLSHGLPLYLSLLTINVRETVDPTRGVVDNFLRWIPEDEQFKRKLVLNAALLSKPFNQDELIAFGYLSEQERSALYTWLTLQPFVQSIQLDGRHKYHELARELFCRYLLNHAPDEYHTIRRTLADFYLQLLLKMEREVGKDAYDSAEWLELAIARTSQLLNLPDKASHIAAIEQVLFVLESAKQNSDISRMPRELSHEVSINLISYSTQKMAKQLLTYIEASIANQDQELITATNNLLEIVNHGMLLSSNWLARIYRNRGKAYRECGEYQLAIRDFSQAVGLDSGYSHAYAGRGETYRLLGEYQKAIDDFNCSIALDPNSPWSYALRGTSYLSLDKYQQADVDFDNALVLFPQFVWVYAARSLSYFLRDEYEQAITDLNKVTEIDPQFAWAYAFKGHIYKYLKAYQQAISDFSHALTLDEDPWVYANRGEAYRLLGEYQKAIDDFDHALVLKPTMDWAVTSRVIASESLKNSRSAFDDTDRSHKWGGEDSSYWTSSLNKHPTIGPYDDDEPGS